MAANQFRPIVCKNDRSPGASALACTSLPPIHTEWTLVARESRCSTMNLYCPATRALATTKPLNCRHKHATNGVESTIKPSRYYQPASPDYALRRISVTVRAYFTLDLTVLVSTNLASFGLRISRMMARRSGSPSSFRNDALP